MSGARFRGADVMISWGVPHQTWESQEIQKLVGALEHDFSISPH